MISEEEIVRINRNRHVLGFELLEMVVCGVTLNGKFTEISVEKVVMMCGFIECPWSQWEYIYGSTELCCLLWLWHNTWSSRHLLFLKIKISFLFSLR